MTMSHGDEIAPTSRGGKFRSVDLADAIAAGLERVADEDGDRVTSWLAVRVQD